jgi:ADP-ribosylglycohydrolase
MPPDSCGDRRGGDAIKDPLAGVLLGTALGDALGLPAEGLRPETIARRFGRLERFRLLGRTGFVSDDTEQSALAAQALVRHPSDPERFARAFRRSLLGWFFRLPWGVGLGTIRACLKAALGFRRTGVASAGNGAAMRAAVVGVFFRDDPARRRAFGRALAEVTHTDPRAVGGALFAADLAAAAAGAAPDADRAALVAAARDGLDEPALGAAIDRARDLARDGAGTAEAARELGTSGYVVHTIAFVTFCFLRHGAEPLGAIQEAAGAGGDADTIGAIVGAWVGSLHGAEGLPGDLLGRIHDGPFGPTHLRSLARALDEVLAGRPAEHPRWSVAGALLRNIALMPVILAHGLRRLIPI